MFDGTVHWAARNLVALLMGLIVCKAAAGNNPTATNPYKGIYQRNVFGLLPPPAPANPAPSVPPPTITLTGITTILGDKRALLKINLPAKPPGQAREDPCILKEGQQDDGVKVLEINEKAGSVKVNNSGEVEVLTFEKNGPHLPQTTQSSPHVLSKAAFPFPLPAAPANRGIFAPSRVR